MYYECGYCSVKMQNARSMVVTGAKGIYTEIHIVSHFCIYSHYKIKCKHIQWPETISIGVRPSSCYTRQVALRWCVGCFFFSFKYWHGDELFHVRKSSWCWPTTTCSVRGCLQDFKMLLMSSYGAVLMCRGIKGDNGHLVRNFEGKV